MSSRIGRITGRQIAAARELLNITQAVLADAIGLRREVLARVESGESNGRDSTLAKIAAELEKRGIEFINGTGVKIKTPSP